VDGCPGISYGFGLYNIIVDVDSVLPSNGTNDLLFNFVNCSYSGGVESL